MEKLKKILVVLASVSLVSACKFAVVVPPGGNVQSLSGTNNCLGPDYCEFDITDRDFSETFTAVPRAGFEFVKWQSGEGYFCANSIDPVCTVALPGGDAGDAVVASIHTGSIRPVFTGQGVDTDGDGTINEIDTDDDNDGLFDDVDDCPLDGPNLNSLGCPTIPLLDTVFIVDRRWAQFYFFPSTTWHDVNAACPPPTGNCFGKIGDVDVSGWTWATGDEVNALLNAFLDNVLGPFPDFIDVSGITPLSPNIFEYFEAEDDLGSMDLFGWTREEANIVEGHSYGVHCSGVTGDNECFDLRAGSWDYGTPTAKTLPIGGAWLYRLE